MNELVSIIVPVYRAASYIAETIAMVERQTYKNWELILVDDASPDNSAEVIADTIEHMSKDRIRLIRKEKKRRCGESKKYWVGCSRRKVYRVSGCG